MTELTIHQPDDWHLHLRDGDLLSLTVPASAQHFARAIVMPNLVPPVTTIEAAAAYRERILSHVPAGQSFEPLMTLYLTDTTSADTIHAMTEHPWLKALKLYPAGATTNSDAGVTRIERISETLAAMEQTGTPLLVHGEVTHQEVDIFDREARFIEEVLAPLMERFPKLKIVLEHITTEQSVRFVEQAGPNIAATITPQHLLFNRNHMLVGGIKPHFYCLPILKRNTHQKALIEAAISGSPKFFAGTDSAPHIQDKKESACGCAGCFSAPHAIELYAHAFDQANAMDKLDDFVSKFGAEFYGLPRNTNTLTLTQTSLTVPAQWESSQGPIIPLMAGESLPWSIAPAQ